MAHIQSQQAATPQPLLVEEKYFPVSLERSADVIEGAIAHALGVPLQKLGYGMWSAEKPVARGHFQEITVRALPTEEGTSVEIRIEDRFSAGSIALAGTLFVLAAFTIIPLFFMIARSQEMQRDNTRRRLIEMHRIWTEIASSLGAPVRAGYRSQPERAPVRAPVRARVEEDGVELEVVVPEEDAKRVTRDAS